MVCKKAAEEMGEGFAKKPIGTGPVHVRRVPAAAIREARRQQAVLPRRAAARRDHLSLHPLRRDARPRVPVRRARHDLRQPGPDVGGAHARSCPASRSPPWSRPSCQHAVSQHQRSSRSTTSACARPSPTPSTARRMVQFKGAGRSRARPFGRAERQSRHRRAGAALSVRSRARPSSCWPRPAIPTASPSRSIQTTLPACRRSSKRCRRSCKKAGIKLDIELVEHATYHAQIRKDLSPIVLYQAARFPVADVYLTQFFHSRVDRRHADRGDQLLPLRVADEEIEAARVRARSGEAEGAVEDARRRRSIKDVCGVPIYEQLQIWAWSDTLDLGYEMTGLAEPGAADHREDALHEVGLAVAAARPRPACAPPPTAWSGHDRHFSSAGSALRRRHAVRGADPGVLLVRIVPGDPAQVILGDQASREAIEALRDAARPRPADLGAIRRRSSPVRCTGDWGVSMVTRPPVIGEI